MFQTLGPLGTVPTLLGGLVALAAVVLVGRFLFNVAWKIVTVAVVVVAALWLVGGVGPQLALLG